MKVVILAGGFGTRISEESHLKPKPMIEIGGKPILWHIMKMYSSYGFNDFIICLGYKGYYIKEYFSNYFLHHSDVTFDFANNNSSMIHNNTVEPWKVTLIDTGLNTMTGGRLEKVKQYVNQSTFMLTYGDGVSNVNIKELIASHINSKKITTVTSVQPPGRFGSLNINTEGEVLGFKEKPKGDGHFINGGFFVMEPSIFNYLDGHTTVLEQEPLMNLSRDRQLNAYKHNGFWHPMDTLRDKVYLEELWESNPPWKTWDKPSEKDGE